MTASIKSIEPGARFTKNSYASKRHLDLLKQNRLIAHHDMMETIISEFHNRKTKNWKATAQKLIQTLVNDTGRRKAPGLRRTQVVLNDLERWGLICRYCPVTAKPIALLNDKTRRMALSNDRGLHIKIAGLDFEVPNVERFEAQLQNRKSPITGDRRVCPVPPDPIKIGGVRSLGEYPLHQPRT